MQTSLKVVLIVLIFIPMLYQIHLLVYEYQTGVTIQLVYQLEPDSDLPALTVCLAPDHLFPRWFLTESIRKYATKYASTSNSCYRYSQILDHGNFSDGETSNLRFDCIQNGQFLARNMTLASYLNHRDALDFTDFASLIILSSDSIGFSRVFSRLQPSTIARHDTYGKCWTFFSRSSRDWYDAQQLSHHTHNSSSSAGEVYHKIPRFQLLRLDVNSAKLFAAHYNLTHLDDAHFSAALYESLITDFHQLDLLNDPVSRHELYRLDLLPKIHIFLQSPYTAGNIPHGKSSTHHIQMIQYARDAYQWVKNFSNQSVINRRVALESLDTRYTKTTINHLVDFDAGSSSSSVNSEQYSDYSTSQQFGYSAVDCKMLTKVGQYFLAQHVMTQTTLCVNLNTRNEVIPFFDPWKQEFTDRFNLSSSPLCHLEGNTRMAKDKYKYHRDQWTQSDNVTQSWIDALVPKWCLADRKKIVFDFKKPTKSDERQIDQAEDESHSVLKTRYIYDYTLEEIPEMTILYVAKMSTIELLASMAGLCGMWLGWSVFGLTCDAKELCWRVASRFYIWKASSTRQNESSTRNTVNIQLVHQTRPVARLAVNREITIHNQSTRHH